MLGFWAALLVAKQQSRCVKECQESFLNVHPYRACSIVFTAFSTRIFISDSASGIVIDSVTHLHTLEGSCIIAWVFPLNISNMLHLQRSDLCI